MQIEYDLYPADWLEVTRRIRHANAELRFRRAALVYLVLVMFYVGSLWLVRPKPGQNAGAWWSVAIVGLLPLFMFAIGQTDWFARRVLLRRLQRTGRAKRLHYRLKLDAQGVTIAQGTRLNTFAWSEFRDLWQDDRYVYLGRGPQNVWVVPLHSLDADEARDLLSTAKRLREQAGRAKAGE